MKKSRIFMGTACVIAMAALAAGPAAADTLTDFAGNLVTAFTNTNDSLPGTKDLHAWTLGGSFGGPLSEFAGLNFQGDASYTHAWASHYSQEIWNFGGSAFWASPDARVGVNGNYTNYNRLGHVTSGGPFGEYYYGNFTGMAKGGWLSSGGAAFGGRGNYYGFGVTYYGTPDLAITGGFNWDDIVTGRGCQICGRRDLLQQNYSVIAEFLINEEFGISGFGGYTYTHHKDAGIKSHDNVWMVGVRWYVGAGTLIDHHRNGNLNPWLSGP